VILQIIVLNKSKRDNEFEEVENTIDSLKKYFGQSEIKIIVG
jgi:hypothetical protein